MNNQNLEKEMMLINEFITPNKQAGKSAADKDIGSTQLRKTIFKKHYTQKIKEMGNEPSMIKGSMSTLNKVQQ